MDRIKNIHPGEVLREEFLVPMGISQYRLAQQIRVPALRISQICAGKRGITADTALRLARAFGTTPGFLAGPAIRLRNRRGTAHAWRRIVSDPTVSGLNRVQREMRNFHGVFGLGDFTDPGEDAV